MSTLSRVSLDSGQKADSDPGVDGRPTAKMILGKESTNNTTSAVQFLLCGRIGRREDEISGLICTFLPIYASRLSGNNGGGEITRTYSNLMMIETIVLDRVIRRNHVLQGLLNRLIQYNLAAPSQDGVQLW